MTKRFIRLKEMEPDTEREHVPAEEYRATVGETLGAGPFRARTDSNGFLLTGNTVDPAASSIIFLGGSFVESLYAPEELRFVSIVERNLAAAALERRCLNGGYSGSNTLHLLNVLINKIYPLLDKDSWVIFFVSQSDADSVLLPANLWTGNTRSSTLIPAVEQEPEVALKGVAATLALLRTAVTAARELGINLAIATGPVKNADYESDELLQRLYRSRDQYEIARECRLAIRRAAREVAADMQCALIDISFEDEKKYFYDELHLNEAGQVHYATLLTAQISKLLLGNHKVSEKLK
jgi:hypothetical protein